MTQKTITTQQRRFLTHYAQTLDIEKSARAAGYRSTNAQTQVRAMLLREPYISELENILAERVSYLEVPRAYIVKKYIELVKYATQADNDAGIPTDPALALRALDGLCKQLPKDAWGTDAGAHCEDNFLTRIEGFNPEKI